MRRWCREAALWLGAVLGLVALGAGVAVGFFGFGFLIFRSGSMSPDLPTGTLALARTVPAPDLRTGDVVSVISAGGVRVTHRVELATLRGDTASLVLRGDANSSADAEVYVVDTADRVVAAVPVAGYVVGYLSTGSGLVVAAGLTGMLLVLGFTEPHRSAAGPQQPRQPRHPRHRRAPARHRTSAAATAVLVVVTFGTTLGVTVGGTTDTSATFTDAPTVTSGSLAAATVGVPATPQTSAGTPVSVTVSWSPATPVGGTTATSYAVYRYAASTGGTGTLACTATAPVLSCTDTAPAATPVHYGLQARIGGRWTNEGARVLYSPALTDTTPPVVSFTRPVAGEVFNNENQMTNQIRNSCGSTEVLACGTASDAATGNSGVAAVRYTVRRSATTGLGTTFSCWVGATWVPSATGTCTFLAATGTTTWQVPGNADTAYASGAATYSWTLTIRATDGAGNVREAVATYRY